MINEEIEVDLFKYGILRTIFNISNIVEKDGGCINLDNELLKDNIMELIMLEYVVRSILIKQMENDL